MRGERAARRPSVAWCPSWPGAGMSLSSLRRFERTGEIALLSLVRIAMALDATEGLMGLFPEQIRSLEDVLDKPLRQRGDGSEARCGSGAGRVAARGGEHRAQGGAAGLARPARGSRTTRRSCPRACGCRRSACRCEAGTPVAGSTGQLARHLSREPDPARSARCLRADRHGRAGLRAGAGRGSRSPAQGRSRPRPY
jgi:hypothetical protein